jgi:hypothetical protein
MKPVREFYEPHPVGRNKTMMTWTERLQRGVDKTLHRNDEKAREKLVALFNAYAEVRDAAYQYEVRGDPYELERFIEYRLFTWGFLDGMKAKERFYGDNWAPYHFGDEK